MPRFTLTIELGNDAMQHQDHVADALEAVADRLRSTVYTDAEGELTDADGMIRDANGLSVGSWLVAAS